MVSILFLHRTGFGAGTGLVFHTGAQWARRLGLTNAKLNRNTLMLSILGGGAFGMFLFSSSTGKEQVHKLHPIFQNGAVPPGELDRQDYRNKMAQVGEQEVDLDMTKMHENRLTRRRTMMDQFKKGHGLNDAHGGHWYKENQK
jgi:hypothetical protein